MRLDVDVYFAEDGSRYVILDEIDESHRRVIASIAAYHDCLFDIEGRRACPWEVVLAYSNEEGLAV